MRWKTERYKERMKENEGKQGNNPRRKERKQASREERWKKKKK